MQDLIANKKPIGQTSLSDMLSNLKSAKNNLPKEAQVIELK